MNRKETTARIIDYGVVAVIRMKDTDRLLKVIEAVREGGVKCIEITMTVPGAVEIIRQLSGIVPKDVLIGAGTVINEETAQKVMDAGATFVVGPVLNTKMIAACINRDTPVLPGCYTPTEISTAWNAGADIIKVFPATTLGPKYFKDLRGPFPDIRLMPTGGVTIDNVGEWIAAGACAVGIGSDLLDKKAIDDGRYEILTERAARMVTNVRKARSA
ncbi:MAG TPA: 2-dehydro-3-deoxyphosphogluconate aldolase [Bacteroidetes bacterium]|nr:2-dehydro-3-deoxyphosphogluconate aldolase [Bacteroidota bacterium]